MKLWTFYRERLDGYIFPRWTCRCNNVDKSGVEMLATVGPMSLVSCKITAARMGWSEDQPTQILRIISTDRNVVDRIQSQLNDLEREIKAPLKAGIQFS